VVAAILTVEPLRHDVALRGAATLAKAYLDAPGEAKSATEAISPTAASNYLISLN
jgi:hypothetical protein